MAAGVFARIDNKARLNTGLIVVLAAFFALYAEMYREAMQAYSTRSPFEGILASHYTDPVALSWLALLFLVGLCVGFVFLRAGGRFLHFVYRYRYIVAVGVVAFCTIFEISGSSIAVWADFLTGSSATGTMFGIPRLIRYDEWIVFTPFAFSQELTGYSGISDLIRAAATDVTMTYAQPSWALPTLFRPFLWGYLLLGSAKGLAFFWIARLVALFLITFECAKLYTSGSRELSAIVALVVTFSPLVQWWFAVNGVAELFIFGQGIVLCAHALTKSSQWRCKIAFAVLLTWCLGGFAFILYPAWQVPLFYVFAVLSVYVVARNWRQPGARRGWDVALFVLSALVFIMLALLCVMNSWDAIRATLGTVYPGKRTEYGGGLGLGLFNYGLSLFGPLDADSMFPNVCELAQVFCLFPIGLVLGVASLVKKRDGLIAGLLAVDAFLLTYACFGFPEILAKATLLSLTTSGRIVLAIGFVEVLLLVRACVVLRTAGKDLSDWLHARTKLPLVALYGGCFLLACVMALVCFHTQRASFRFVFLALLFLVFLTLVFLVVRLVCFKDRSDERRLFAAFAVFMLVSGMAVNPVQKGIDVVQENESIKMIKKVSAQDPAAKWAADTHVYGQACIMGGAACVNSINTYPNLALWESLDPERLYADVYNRYASIYIDITRDKTTFELEAADTFVAHVNVDDIEKLGITYFVSERNLDEYDTDKVDFTLVADTNSKLFVYRVDCV